MTRNTPEKGGNTVIKEMTLKKIDMKPCVVAQAVILSYTYFFFNLYLPYLFICFIKATHCCVFLWGGAALRLLGRGGAVFPGCQGFFSHFCLPGHLPTRRTWLGLIAWEGAYREDSGAAVLSLPLAVTTAAAVCLSFWLLHILVHTTPHTVRSIYDDV